MSFQIFTQGTALALTSQDLTLVYILGTNNVYYTSTKPRKTKTKRGLIFTRCHNTCRNMMQTDCTRQIYNVQDVKYMINLVNIFSRIDPDRRSIYCTLDYTVNKRKSFDFFKYLTCN